MPGLAFNPNVPAAHSPLSSAEMRDQFQAIQNNIDAVREQLQLVQPLGLTVSNPLTQAQVQAIANKLDELINTLLAV
jgi:hypothetical protein